MKNPFLSILALVVGYLATPPGDHKKIADLHRAREAAFDGEELTVEENQALSDVLRAAEVSNPTLEAKSAAERLAQHLEKSAPEHTFENPNGEAETPEKPSGESSPESEIPAGQSQNAPPADEVLANKSAS